MSEVAVAPGPPAEETGRSRIVRIAIWIGGLLALVVVLQLAGVDIRGWLADLWDAMNDISLAYIVIGCVFQGLQTALVAYAWYRILRYAYSESGITYLPILAAYAVGVALNNVVPANLGTFVTLLMYVAVVHGSTFPGVFAGYLVHKIFYTVVGGLVYLYLFLEVAGSFDFAFGNERDTTSNHVAHARDHRRHGLAGRDAPARLLALREEAVGAGEGGRRDPRAIRGRTRRRSCSRSAAATSRRSASSASSSPRIRSRSLSARS